MIAQRPYDEAGEPFPTTFWLSCRVLVRAVGELESSGGIAALEAELAARPGLRASRRRPTRASLRCAPRSTTAGRAPTAAPRLRRASRAERRRRPLKCLHAHAAAALAAPPYALGRLVLERAGATPPEVCCAWA